MSGEVVVVPFPFSDLSTSKNRPALVLIDLAGPDVVLAPITSTRNSPHAITLEARDFQTGGLHHASFIHPTKLFTCERSRIRKSVGTITLEKRKEVVSTLVALLN
jgi:mRNA interferase MazF